MHREPFTGYLTSCIGVDNIPVIHSDSIKLHKNNIWLLITGRFIAGLGAISTPITSMAIDSVPEDRRNTAMTITGIGNSINLNR